MQGVYVFTNSNEIFRGHNWDITKHMGIQWDVMRIERKILEVWLWVSLECTRITGHVFGLNEKNWNPILTHDHTNRTNHFMMVLS
jgi:hypothetical protein